jgi:predicted protein tyrosine phosphatase
MTALEYTGTPTLFSGSFLDQLPRADIVRATAGTASRVDAHVYISGYLVAADPRFVRQAGITRIVKLFADDPGYPGGATRLPGVKYLVLPFEDSPDYDIRAGAAEAVRFIQDGVRANEIVLVHCHAGVSRSATVVLLYMMITRGFVLDTAMARLRLVRPFIRPNAGFMEHLRATDARLKRLYVSDEQPFVGPPPVLAYNAPFFRGLER